ncbi:hypothetical protein [Virgisporangium aurantiacum]|uniref:hypothetical protein n=1 Tax=Virgisporangium aurantiacum TaxID=175570 RepID=UPI001EF25BA9|nr:hypothetical protein [Virgisporangium aurantiacum]
MECAAQLPHHVLILGLDELPGEIGPELKHAIEVECSVLGEDPVAVILGRCGVIDRDGGESPEDLDRGQHVGSGGLAGAHSGMVKHRGQQWVRLADQHEFIIPRRCLTAAVNPAVHTKITCTLLPLSAW